MIGDGKAEPAAHGYWAYKKGRALLDGPPNPFEIWCLIAACLSGVAAIAGAYPPSVSLILLESWERHMWAVLLGLGGAIALTGRFWRGDRFTGILIKRPGLVAVAGGCLVYGIAAAARAPGGIATAITNVSFAIAALWRVWQVSRQAAEYRRILSAAAATIREQEGADE